MVGDEWSTRDDVMRVINDFILVRGSRFILPLLHWYHECFGLCSVTPQLNFQGFLSASCAGKDSHGSGACVPPCWCSPWLVYTQTGISDVVDVLLSRPSKELTPVLS